MTLDITGYRLRNQFLSQKLCRPGVVVAACCQSQDYAGGKWALGLRMTGAADAALDQAFHDGKIPARISSAPPGICRSQDIRWMLAQRARVHMANGL
jgi:hypothetical protein